MVLAETTATPAPPPGLTPPPTPKVKKGGGGKGKGGGGGLPTVDPTTAPMTWDQIQQEAMQQAAASIASVNAPLQAQVDTLGSQKTAAQQEISQEYQSLLPYIADSAGAVKTSYDQATQMEQQIFQAAGQRMNQLQQNSAAEAQQLAQQMGGPVATSQFTQALDPYVTAGAEQGSSEMLHALGLAQAGEQEAQQFAGQVFPAMQTEQTAQSDQYFNDQMKTLTDEMGKNAASKSDLVNSNLNTLLQNERQFKLNLAQLKQSKLKASRDWLATKAQLKAEGVKTALAKSAVTGVYKGKPTLAAIKLSTDQKLAAQRLGLSAAEFKARLAKSTVSTEQAQQRLNVESTKNAMSIIDSAMNPMGNKPVTMTTKQYIQKGSLAELHAESGKSSGAYYDPKRKQWYQYQRLTLTPAQWAKQGGYTGATPISDPQRLYDLVRGSVPNLPPKTVLNMVRAKTGLQNWSPGQKSSYTGKQLSGMSLNELRGLASDRGLKKTKGVGRQGLMDYILHHASVPGG